MEPNISDAVFGVVGFAGFEALRIYKRLWADLSIVPGKRPALYSATLAVLAVLSAALAVALANGSIVEAIFVGFSVPSGIKTLIERPDPRINSETVDDIALEDAEERENVVAAVNRYFSA